jgi:ABC-type uncharacterized transport system substrate-binding protein
VWIDARAELGVDDEGRLETVTITWIFDEFYSAFSVEGFDKDRDGKPDPVPMEAMVAQAGEDLREWGYFTDLRLKGERVTWGPLKAHSASWDNGRLIYRYVLGLAEPLPLAADAKDLSLRLYDPTFYISILLEERPDAAHLVGAPEGCALSVQEPDGVREVMIDDAVAMADEVQPGQEGLGAAFAQTIGVSCP